MGKLFVIKAKDVPEAIIIRRGPSRWSHLISWDMKSDRFEHGAWIRGRIDAEKCDLSSDGKLFLYFVLKGCCPDPAFSDSWTALSQPPWLTALALWPEGGTWMGGGEFIGPRTIARRPTGEKCHPDFENHYVEIDENTVPAYKESAGIVTDSYWSGYDHKGNIIYSKGDSLFRVFTLSGREKQIADFSDLTPDPQPAPSWAKKFERLDKFKRIKKRKQKRSKRNQ